MATTQSIQLYWASLKNEIDAETWKAGKCYITEDKAEERAEAQTGNDTLDINYCYRKIEQGIMQLQDIAHKFFTGFTRNGSASSYTIVKLTNNDDSSSTIKVGKYLGKDDDDNYMLKDAIEYAHGTSVTLDTYKTDLSSGSSTVTSSLTVNSDYTKTELGTISSGASSSSTSDNKLNNGVSYWTITLKFGDRQNVNISLLATELHKYVVLNVLQEWCKIANPTLTNEYVSRQQAEEVRIKSIMYRKEEPNWAE